MNTNDRQSHWDNIYTHKKLEEVSWYQATPTTSLAIIEGLQLSKEASIIDVGGGDSYLVDNLMAHGFEQLSVLDISALALERARTRMGEEMASKVQWLVADIAGYQPQERYDCWHDRAAFHFLTQDEDIANYVRITSEAIRSGGYMILGTFAEDGPLKCSGIEIRRYTANDLENLFEENFTLEKDWKFVHETPFQTTQSFVFVLLKRK